MARSPQKLKVIRITQRAKSRLYKRSIHHFTVSTKKTLTEAIKAFRGEERLWIALELDGGKRGSLWVAITGNRAWIALWEDEDSIDTHAKNPAYSGPDEYIEFLLDNLEKQMVHASYTFKRSKAISALGHFLLYGAPPPDLAFGDELDTYC